MYELLTGKLPYARVNSEDRTYSRDEVSRSLLLCKFQPTYALHSAFSF